MTESSSDSGCEETNLPSIPIRDVEQDQLLTNQIHRNIPLPSQGLTQLAHYIADACDEEQTKIIVRVTHFLGREKALNFLQWALNLQKNNGGFTTKSNVRLRTLGDYFSV